MFAEKTRLLLTIMAIAWGTASIAGMLAVGEGLRVTFGQAMQGVGYNVMVVRGGQTTQNFRGQPINQTIKLTRQDLQHLKSALPDTQITPEYSFMAKLEHGNKGYSTMVSAVTPLYAKLRNLQVANGGRFINHLDMQNARRTVVLGVKVAESLFKPGINPVGKTLLVANQPFTVIGVERQKLQLVNYQTPDNYLTWIPANTYIVLNQPQFINDIIIVPQSTQENESIETQVRKIIALDHGVNPSDKGIVNILSAYKYQQQSATLFQGMQFFLGIIGALTLIIAGVGIANVMFISVRRATRDIGIRMAIGARSYQILTHYILEALLTTAIGGLLGLAAAKGIIELVNLIPMHGEFFQFIGKPKPQLSATVVFVVIAVLGCIGFLSGFFPAKKAANIDPAEALRYE